MLFPAAVPSAKGRARYEREPTGENANFSDNSDNSDPAPPGCAVASSAQTMERGEGREKAFLTVPTEHRWSHSIREIAVSNFRVVQVSDLLRVWGA